MTEDDCIPLTLIIPIIHGKNIYKEHAHGTLTTNKIAALKAAYNSIPDGMFKEGYLARQGMEELFNDKFALVQHTTLASDFSPTQMIANNAQWDEDGYLINSQDRIIVPHY